MDLIKDFLQDKIKEKYLVERIFKMKQEMEWSIILQEKNWGKISANPNLSIDFLKKYKNHINWRVHSYYGLLSEEIIEEFLDRVDWEMVSYMSDLSDEFIKKHRDLVVMKYITIRRSYYE